MSVGGASEVQLRTGVAPSNWRGAQSERFGEKWARHWLDAARYSDSNGYEKDMPREQWKWRDWVVDALNRDLSYKQFLIEQFAGDLLPAPRPLSRARPRSRSSPPDFSGTA